MGYKLVFISIGLISVSFMFCGKNNSQNGLPEVSSGIKTGVLLVNHGSRSESWRQAMYDLESRVSSRILAKGNVSGIKTAHMEYTEPSIATRLKEFDQEGYTDVIIVPVFLTVSPHTFDDIPTIIGQKTDSKSLEVLKIEKIERYTPRARIKITPNLDFTEILKHNVERRVRALSAGFPEEGLVLIGYGDESYEKEWKNLFSEIGKYVQENTGINSYSYGWCGHIVHYNPDSTTKPINAVLSEKKRAVVIPVLVAVDEMFQIKIIGDGIAKVDKSFERVLYKPDAILPDDEVDNWIIDITDKYSAEIESAAL